MPLLNLIHRQDKTRDDSVVARVRKQTTEAAQLAAIPDQALLHRSDTNPAVREYADQLRDDRHRRDLDAAHRRRIRRDRVADRHAEIAERKLEALHAARETTSPARDVLALDEGRRRFMAAALAASLMLSVGAASGIAQLAKEYGAPWQAGWVAEVGLTGLTTMVILYRSHLAQHGGKVSGWQAWVLWALMLVPLAVSMAANLAGAGPVGVACSAGAVAFSLLSYVIADRSADALHERAGQVTGDDEDLLRTIAAEGDPAPAQVTAPQLADLAPPAGHHLSDGDLVALGADTAEALAYLASRGVELPAEEVVRALAVAPRPSTPSMPSARRVTSRVTSMGGMDPRSVGGSPFQVSDLTAPQVTPQVTRQVTPASAQVTAKPLPQATPEPVAQATPQTTKTPAPRATRKPPAKSPGKPRHRTDDELIAELEVIVADHYRENPGKEIKVKPLATQLGIGRDRARRLLDQMSVRPMKKAANR